MEQLGSEKVNPLFSKILASQKYGIAKILFSLHCGPISPEHLFFNYLISRFKKLSAHRVVETAAPQYN